MLFYSNLIYSQKYSSSAAPYFQCLNTYFWQHVSAKKVFAKTAFQIWQALLQFYYRFLKFRKCFGQWFLFYSSQCFIAYVFYGWFLPINIFIKPLTTRKNNLFFLSLSIIYFFELGNRNVLCKGIILQWSHLQPEQVCISYGLDLLFWQAMVCKRLLVEITIVEIKIAFTNCHPPMAPWNLRIFFNERYQHYHRICEYAYAHIESALCLWLYDSV